MSSTGPGVAICCYSDRVVAAKQCARCKRDYGCLTFKTTAELVQFNALIPASMLVYLLQASAYRQLAGR